MRKVFVSRAYTKGLRLYATEAEYTISLGQNQESQAALMAQGPPSLLHFSSWNQPEGAISKHNSNVASILAKVNQDDVRIKYLKADINEPLSLGLMQQLGFQNAPILVAMQKGSMLDSLQGIHGELSFLSKFASFAGVFIEDETTKNETVSNPLNSPLEEKFAAFALRVKKSVHTTDSVDLLSDLSSLLKDIDKAVEKEDLLGTESKAEIPKKRKDSLSTPLPPPPASRHTQLMALTLRAELEHQTGLSDISMNTIQQVRKLAEPYSVPGVYDALNLLEMALLSGFNSKISSKEYGEKVVSDPENMDLQLKLSVSMFLEGLQKEGIALALQVLRKNKDFNNGAPKKILMCAFRVLGPKSEITKEGKKKMMSYIF